MADVSEPTLADRARQLIIDVQHAMDSNSPISLPMMKELKDIVAIGISEQARADAEHHVAQVAAAKARGIADHIKAEGDDLAASVGEVAPTGT